MSGVKGILSELTQNKELGDRIVHIEYIPSKKPEYSKLFPPLSNKLKKALKKKGIEKLYSHQASAINHIRSGENVATITPTASGKTLIYNIPVLESLLSKKNEKFLYVFPIKALAQDQMKTIQEYMELLNLDSGEACIYDGDTPSTERSKIKKEIPSIVFTNPDMLHLGIIPYHSGWQELFKNLKYVIIDEVHSYRGIFGSHVAQIIRRLRRICKYYGSNPQFIALSATITNADEFLYKLFGVKFKIVSENGTPSSSKYFLLWNPTFSPYTEATTLLKLFLEKGLKTIVFTKARKITELIYHRIIEEMPYIASKVSSYRAGYLPEERREIEKKLFLDKLKAVISTSALETGIDVGSLDACILIGYPGTIISTWQRSGRVGRGTKESIIILIGIEDALDQYFIRHPEVFFTSKFESAILNENNPVVLREHILCASSELPFSDRDFDIYDEKISSNTLKLLKSQGRIKEIVSSKEWVSMFKNPQLYVDIRSTGERYSIVEQKRQNTIKTIGDIDSSRVFRECHPGAIYLHAGIQYMVLDLDTVKKQVTIQETGVDYYTEPRTNNDIEILGISKRKQKGKAIINFGKVKVTEQVVGFVKKKVSGQYIIDEQNLNLPAYTFETTALWINLSKEEKDELLLLSMDLSGGLHGVEHSLISIFPIFSLCDRTDLGGISYTAYGPQTGTASIFIYDGYPGGVGLSEHGFDKIDELCKTTFMLVSECDCYEGCPACIHSPKCGNGNKPLDKDATVKILSNLNLSASHTCKTDTPMEKQDEHQVVSEPNIVYRNKNLGNLLFFDLETQNLSSDVGGWNNKHLFKLSVGVTYNTKHNNFNHYTEENVDMLIKELKSADLIVGFNIKNFDLQVLQPYSNMDLSTLPVFDILETVHKELGFRLSLEHLGIATLSAGKLGDGIQAVEWFRKGEIEKVIEYCKNDVQITRDLFEFGVKYGYLLYTNRQGSLTRIPFKFP